MLETSLSRYIWTHTKAQQLWILAIVALSMIPYFMSFNLPKQIVNGPIQGGGFEAAGATQLFMKLSVPIPGYGDVLLFPGLELGRLGTLFALSTVFLALVIINGLFKYYINIYKGKLGERLLRRIRFSLVDNILRFPPATFKRMKGAELASMIKDEVEPLGGFTGDAFVSPAFLGGQALTALIFIFVQSVPLGILTAIFVGVQVLIIPRMRRRLLVLGRERQLTARELAGRVSEIVDGIGTIHAYDTSNYERADIASRLGRIFSIRFDIYQWKFLVKFINNFLASLTPFVYYSVGGYLALSGRLDIGQLVAVIGAYKDLPGPLKDLIDWDQTRQDVQIKYQQVIGQFDVDGMISPALHALPADGTDRPDIGRPLAAVNLVVADDAGGISLEGINFAFSPGEAIAFMGLPGSGGDTLAEAFGRQVWPSGGRILVGEANLLNLPESLSGQAITYTGSESYFFSGTLLDNLLYGLKNAPGPSADGEETALGEWQRHEAALAGNLHVDPSQPWINLNSLDLEDDSALMRQAFEVLDCVALTQDIQDLALRATVSSAAHPELAARVVEARGLLRDELARENLGDLVVPFEPGAYNIEATVRENLLFGHTRSGEIRDKLMDPSSFFFETLNRRGLCEKLGRMGAEIARNIVGLFADLPPDHRFFRQLTIMSAEEIPIYQQLLQKFESAPATVTAEDRVAMMRLALEYIEPRYRFGLLSQPLMADIVAFRRDFQDHIPAAVRADIDFYDPANYLESASLIDNILFGRISLKYRDGAERIRAHVIGLLKQLGFYDSILTIGLSFDVGTGGRRLSAGQRQKLALARALMRRSEYYIFNRPLLAQDGRSQARILEAVLKRLRGNADPVGILWVGPAPAQARQFDRIAVFNQGHIIEEGTAAELSEKSGIFKEMIAA